MDNELITVILVSITLGLLFLMGIGVYANTSLLSPETLNDICFNLTNKSDVEAYVEDGNLICEVPSFDSTNNIIIRSSGND